MRKIRNINEITETDLMNIKNSLIKFDEYLRDFAIKSTDKNVALYEHWIDCMGDIEDIIITERWKLIFQKGDTYGLFRLR